MRPPDASFLSRCMKRYYFERFDMIGMPHDMAKREFGYRGAGARMVRHLQMHDAADLRIMLMQTAPLEVYVSNARYLFPTQPMSEKVWEDAHLIFDIDAKDLNLKCRPSHTTSYCAQCGTQGTDRCERCGTQNMRKVSVTCMSCIKAAKEQVSRLLDILDEDLGIRDGINVYFSGNEGFHVHVHDKRMALLGAAERADIVDHIRFQGILPERLGIARGGPPELPRASDRGWPGRFARLLSRADRARIKKATSGGYDALTGIVHEVADSMGVRIDSNVTMDIHRIFRMPGTVNGKSGMAKVICKDLKSFNPYVDAVVISDEPVWVRASCSVQFHMMNRRFGPYANEYVEVPSYAAAYMICKGLAHIVDV